MWLEAAVEETDEKGNRHRTTRNRDQGRGTPQGAPISPLLSNIYMRRFVKGWKTGGHERRLVAHIVNYADDFVICCRGLAEQAMGVMRGMMSRLKLTVNETKTRLCRLPEETFDFLGYTLGRNYDRRTGAPYLGPRPSRKKIDRLCGEISELTGRGTTWLEVEAQIGRINRKLRGWSNYFRIGTVNQAYRNIDSHVRYRVRQWLCAKFKVPGQGKARYPDAYLYQELRLYRLQRTWRQRSRVRTCELSDENRLVRKLDAGKLPVQFDERGVETGHGRDGGTPADERAGEQGKTNFDLNHRATPRLYC
jgi:RNA-directed DNA polymerase